MTNAVRAYALLRSEFVLTFCPRRGGERLNREWLMIERHEKTRKWPTAARTKTFSREMLLGALVVIATLTQARVAFAVDTQPWDFVAAPPRTSGVVLYSTYGSADRAITNGVKTDAQLYSFVNIVRAVHYFKFLGHTVDLNILLPVGFLKDGRIGSTSLGDASGIGDLSIVGAAWLVNQPERQFYVVAAGYLSVPTGSYKPGQPLNLGGNRVTYSLQLGATYGLGARWLAEGVVDVTFYGDNHNVDGSGGKLSQDHTYAGQAWLSYQLTQSFKVSAGYGINFGGDQKVNGVANGFTSQKQQVRAAATYFLTPTTGILGQVNHDFEVKGGFEQDISFLLRLMKLF